MNNYQVRPFSHYVLRTPLFPLSFYWDVLNKYSEEALLLQLENPYFREAIRMASPELLTALDKWKTNPSSLSDKKRDSLKLSLLKYIARISARCTPFGLFAGCTVGKIAPETNIVLNSPENFSRFTQFDMQFWVALLQDFPKREEVSSHLKYYPNNSIYALGDFYRYIEYNYVKTKREHSISALRKTELLNNLVLRATSGLTLDEMILLLADDASERAEALKFIDQLINFQFLISELDATVTGSDEWGRVFSIIDKIPNLKEETRLLQRIKKQLLVIDQTLAPYEKNYKAIKDLIQKTGVDYDEKYLFQTDLNTTTSINTLSTSSQKKVFQAVRFLNGIQKQKKSENQTSFIKAFIQRYESREMPMATVLDTETGIGYLQNSEMNDTHEILEKFSFKSKVQESVIQSWSFYDFIMEKKLRECILKNKNAVSLSENDFPDFDPTWNKAPATFSVMIEIALHQEKEILTIESSGDVSAAKLLGRFCNGNDAIYNLTNEIVAKEATHHSDKILAEIVHIPESRTGNILRRPVLRAFEIAYLANSGVSQDCTIDLNDLMISIRNNKIILRSKKHNKEVIPCLSNAHNYATKSLPIYHFLCDLQSQGVKPIYSFSWGVLETHYDFFPRVDYNGILLSKSKWMVHKSEIMSFYKMDGSQLFEAFSIWRKQRSIPRLVNWAYFDNTLLLDFEKEIGIQLFLKSVTNHAKITLEEFLFTEESVVKNTNGENFVNQFILSFYKDQLV
ncbi:lantibiotic dehydratase family protein [Flavobacterium glaciei]|uniref:Lantibiotic biosynthesis dehydratase-like protein n=1 Tax=Flavobacterium glaciei TaxID=386300 RepID=A0A562PPT0_9FLAO|nr:lantibiotic dehydratase family protein [Flavobacterium glaciei]RDI53566.1 lantibiotic biosynthesis dehydratase-like protein [Flavobacterium glaciei]TWI46467.1 lantibiotic biosynthesis dehydratase-like protein [Flavobacterium glaciei]